MKEKINRLARYVKDAGATRLYGWHIKDLQPLILEGFTLEVDLHDPEYPTRIFPPKKEP